MIETLHFMEILQHHHLVVHQKRPQQTSKRNASRDASVVLRARHLLALELAASHGEKQPRNDGRNGLIYNDPHTPFGKKDIHLQN